MCIFSAINSFNHIIIAGIVDKSIRFYVLLIQRSLCSCLFADFYRLEGRKYERCPLVINSRVWMMSQAMMILKLILVQRPAILFG